MLAGLRQAAAALAALAPIAAAQAASWGMMAGPVKLPRLSQTGGSVDTQAVAGQLPGPAGGVAVRPSAAKRQANTSCPAVACLVRQVLVALPTNGPRAAAHAASWVGDGRAAEPPRVWQGPGRVTMHTLVMALRRQVTMLLPVVVGVIPVVARHWLMVPAAKGPRAATQRGTAATRSRPLSLPRELQGSGSELAHADGVVAGVQVVEVADVVEVVGVVGVAVAELETGVPVVMLGADVEALRVGVEKVAGRLLGRVMEGRERVTDRLDEAVDKAVDELFTKVNGPDKTIKHNAKMGELAITSMSACC